MMIRKSLYLLLYLSLITLSAGCGEKAKSGYLDQLSSRADFESLKNKPLSSKYGKTETVKFYYKRSTNTLYFIDSKLYTLHYHFAEQVLGFWRGHYFFNEYAYSDDDSRDEYFGDLNYYPDLDVYALEFAPSDGIHPDQIAACYRAVVESSFIGSKLQLLAVNPDQRERMLSIQPQVKLLDPNEVFQGLSYQSLIPGSAYGYLRLWNTDSLKTNWPSTHDLLLLDHSPLDLPPTAGVLCAEFQTPLSHLTVLCANRKTPFASYRSLFDSTYLEGLLPWRDSLMQLTIEADTFYLRPALINEAQAYWDKRRPQKEIELTFDLEKRGLIAGNKLGFKSSDHTGSKAANYGELKNISTNAGWVTTPGEAFAIPFYYYHQHLKTYGIDRQIDSLIREPGTDRKVIEGRLKRIRKAIKSNPVSPDLLVLIERQVQSKNMANRLRFRSSTNAEDLPGFNGAGLYQSKTGILGDSTKTPEKAIRKVWASLWNSRAYFEREYFGIDQRRVYMGILVHRSFPDEVANGVAITINPYDVGNPGHLINVQHGELSVVNPPPGVVCDQLVYINNSRMNREKPIIEYVTINSSGKEVLSEAEIQELAHLLNGIRNHFYRHTRTRVKEDRFAVDVEFKVVGPERQIIIKQARPYPQMIEP